MWSRRGFFAFTAILIPFVALRSDAEVIELDRYVGKDLWKQRLSKKDLSRLDQIVGKVPKGYLMEPAPWHIWKINRNGQTRYVVLLAEGLVSIPGGSSACVQLFDANGTRINSWSFQTGWRIGPENVSIEFSKDLASDLIVLHMVRAINGRDIAKEYFAISNDRLRFVRMESRNGDIFQNEYVFPNFEIGIVPDATTGGQWVSLLESSDQADVLSALLFLGGRHITEPQRHFDSEPQESKYAGLFQQLLSNPRIRELIGRLSNSDDAWVRQAALLAARGPRERLLQ
jgi:hypothetical protein